MEDSIKHAEELVHETKSTLARIKFNMPFDDLFKDFSADSSVFLEKLRHNRRKKDTILPIQEELEKLENEVRADTNDILSSMDDLLDPIQYLSARQKRDQPKLIEKIHEINQKIEKRKEEIAKNEILKSLDTVKPKPNSKIQFEKEITKEENPKYEILPKKPISSPNPAESDKSSQVSLNKTFTITRPKKSAVSEDLKKNILQTEEVVDRGFKTVKQLKQKLDFLTKNDKKTSSCEKISLSSKSLEHVSPRSVRSFETVKSFDGEKNRKMNEHKENGKKKKREICRKNVSVFDVKYSECKKHHGKKLKLQKLPSLQVGNGLRLQKIPSIDIPPQEVEELTEVSNAVVKNFVYGEDKIDKKNVIAHDVASQKRGKRLIECTHCGKGVSVFDDKIDYCDVDELLLKCDFDVFDPRIDEFVEKEFLGKHKCNKNVQTREEDDILAENPIKDKKEKKEKQKIERREKIRKECAGDVENKSHERKEFMKITELGEEISRKYKEKTMKIENDYLEFEGILRDIFKKVDESREVFEGTQYFSNSEKEKNLRRLSATRPVVVALESFDKALPGPINEVLKENTLTRVPEDTKFVDNIVKGKNTNENSKLNNGKKIEEKDRQEKYKRLEEIRRKSIPSPKSSSGSDEPVPPPILKFVRGSRNIFPSSSNKISTKELAELQKTMSPKKKLPERIEIDKSASEHSESYSSHSSSDRALKVEENSKASSQNNDVKTDEDYQSDFEVESIENSIELPLDLDNNTSVIEFPIVEERGRESNRYVNRLPTISEKDSEMEKKISSSSVSESGLISERVSEVVNVLPKEMQEFGEMDASKKEQSKTEFREVGFQMREINHIFPVQSRDNLTSPKTTINLSPKEMFEQKSAESKFFCDPDFSKFEKKVDEGLQKVLDKAFENGLSYMLKRQNDILDFNYKATKRKNFHKKNKHFKKPEVELLSCSSGSDIGTKIEFERSNYPKKINKLEKNGNISSKLQTSSKLEMKSSSDQNLQVNLTKNNQGSAVVNENSSKEVVNSLKELLDVLKAQFTRTEILADKLTENVKEKQVQKEEKVENLKSGIILSSLNPLENSKYLNNIIFNNLQRSRKDFNSSARKKSRNIFTQSVEEENIQNTVTRSKFLNLSPKNLDTMQLARSPLPVAGKVIRKNSEKSSPSGTSNFSYSSRDDQSLSAGEILGRKSVNDPLLVFRKRKGKQSSLENSSISEGASVQISKSSRMLRIKDHEEKFSPEVPPIAIIANDSISEGEVPSCGLVDNKCDSSQSIGEVISEQISAESPDEEIFN